MKKAIFLVVSFGTTYKNTRECTLYFKERTQEKLNDYEILDDTIKNMILQDKIKMFMCHGVLAMLMFGIYILKVLCEKNFKKML